MAKKTEKPQAIELERIKYNPRGLQRIRGEMSRKNERIEELKDKINILKKGMTLLKIEEIKASGYVLEKVPRRRKVKGEVIWDEVGYKTWIEDFVDEDTGEVVSIGRKQVVKVNEKWIIN